MDRILVTEPLAEEGLQVLRTQADVDIWDARRTEMLAEIIHSYQALVVRSKTSVSARLISAASQLRVIGRVGTGVDNIDLDAATRRGIVVVNAPYGNTVAVAEHTLAMLLALARSIPSADAALRQGRWEKQSFEGAQLRGRMLGLVGLGRVGSAVARRAQGLEMKVIAYDPYVTPERAAQIGVQWVPFDALLRTADVVSLHVPLGTQTRGMIGRQELAAMKPTAYLVNCARGSVVDEGALADALRGRRLAGAALDVFAQEPLHDSPLLQCDNVVLTPHLAGSTIEAQREAAMEVAQQVLQALAGCMPRYPVNAPALAAEELEQLGPYLDLAGRLGSFCGQFADNHVQAVEVACSGDVVSQHMDALLSAALVGLLAGTAEEAVNWVNAQTIARERGIGLSARHEPLGSATGLSSLIEVRLLRGAQQHVAAGTILRAEPHIVQVDGHWLDFVARGLLLVSEHTEQPGILGRMGTVLGTAGVNIHFVQVGRRERGGAGMLVLGLDDPLTPAVLAEVMALPSVRSARMVKL